MGIRAFILALSFSAAAGFGCPEEASVAPVEVGADTDTGPGPGSAAAGVWVVDAEGVAAGVLFRRGSDDNIADRAYYDIVTVYHPGSGLFYELTLSDGRVRLPGDVFFTGSRCNTPVGLSVGGCQECRSAPGVGFLHEGQWYRAVPGVLYQQTPNGSVLGSGLAEECVAHGTSNSKAYPVEPVTGATPPTSFAPPLSFDWR